jgi:hypothetical protein
MSKKLFNRIARPEYYHYSALAIVFCVFFYIVVVKSHKQQNTPYEAAAEALLSLGSTFAIVTSGSFAYSTLINNRFYELHKRFYSDEILKARQIVDTSPISRISEYQSNLDNLEYVYPTRKILKLISDKQKTEQEVIERLTNIYLLQIDGDKKTFSRTTVNCKNKKYENFYLFIESLDEDYYEILKFVNFLNSACIAYDSRMVPYSKFIHAFGPILKSYYPYFTRAFVEHRRKVHESQNNTPNERLYEFLVKVSKDMMYET